MSQGHLMTVPSQTAGQWPRPEPHCLPSRIEVLTSMSRNSGIVHLEVYQRRKRKAHDPKCRVWILRQHHSPQKWEITLHGQTSTDLAESDPSLMLVLPLSPTFFPREPNSLCSSFRPEAFVIQSQVEDLFGWAKKVLLLDPVYFIIVHIKRKQPETNMIYFFLCSLPSNRIHIKARAILF